MGRRRSHAFAGRRRVSYRASPLWRHRIRVRWLRAQRTRLRNYLSRFAGTDATDRALASYSGKRPD
ncbi:hypothetical protein [Microbulbifer magnicolonia]|uniref:hypothetical protein n=1 Tax=Microbulbifer magnicolonia TaxID=3109744 RepID=UPI002B40AEE9|nr:hypothetical protein [Microbulbifer sp. GG15]